MNLSSRFKGAATFPPQLRLVESPLLRRIVLLRLLHLGCATELGGQDRAIAREISARAKDHFSVHAAHTGVFLGVLVVNHEKELVETILQRQILRKTGEFLIPVLYYYSSTVPETRHLEHPSGLGYYSKLLT